MKRFDIYLTNLNPDLTNLNPAIGKEIKKIRPVVIVSSDDLNDELGTVIIAPMTTKIRNWPIRILVNFANKNGEVALDQMRVVDKSRLKKKLGALHGITTIKILEKLREMFS